MTSSTAASVMKAGAWTRAHAKGGGGEGGNGNGSFSRVGVVDGEREDEMFLFDEDLAPRHQHAPIKHATSSFRNCSPVALVMKGLEYLTMGDRDEDEDDEDDNDETLLSVSKTENNNFLHPRRFPHLYGQSPGELASSVDSDLSASITIEGLRDHLQSCFTCGVLWRENQTSLDCHECDGYALSRPCLDCNGSCAAIWTRDVTTSHQLHKAKWLGNCKLLRNCSIGTESCESSTQLSDN